MFTPLLAHLVDSTVDALPVRVKIVRKKAPSKDEEDVLDDDPVAEKQKGELDNPQVQPTPISSSAFLDVTK